MCRYIHACIHTYIHTYIHSYIHSFIHTYIHTYTHTYAYIYIYICDMCVCMYKPYIYIYIPTWVCVCVYITQAHTHTKTHPHTQSHVLYIDIYIYIYIYLYLVTPPPMNYRPSFCVVKTVVNQLFTQVRIPYLSKTAQNQTHISRESTRSLVQVRREHALNGNTVLFQSTANFFLRKKNMFWETIRPNSTKMVFWFSLGKNFFSAEKPTFS